MPSLNCIAKDSNFDNTRSRQQYIVWVHLSQGYIRRNFTRCTYIYTANMYVRSSSNYLRMFEFFGCMRWTSSLHSNRIHKCWLVIDDTLWHFICWLASSNTRAWESVEAPCSLQYLGKTIDLYIQWWRIIERRQGKQLLTRPWSPWLQVGSTVPGWIAAPWKTLLRVLMPSSWQGQDRKINDENMGCSISESITTLLLS
jgi:hypothetical protein